jgi:hypothetical protein
MTDTPRTLLSRFGSLPARCYYPVGEQGIPIRGRSHLQLLPRSPNSHDEDDMLEFGRSPLSRSSLSRSGFTPRGDTSGLQPFRE